MPRIAGQAKEKQTAKRRAACDECRTKKLKCTGEQPACSRCGREGISCRYSLQKPMGRPKKRQRTEDEDEVARTGGLSGRRHDGGTTAGRERQQTWEHVPGASLADMDPEAQTYRWDDEALNYHSPDGSLQPWLRSSAFDWPDIPPEHALPDLTFDASTNSGPAILNLPPELQRSHHAHRETRSTHVSDPSLPGSNLGCPPTPTCACLSSLYLTLSSLQSLSPNCNFPSALPSLRAATQTAQSVLSCDTCPQTFLASLQNTHLLATLLVTIAERYAALLAAITEEAEAVSAEGGVKEFRLADLPPPSNSSGSGIGCAAAFSIELTPAEWRAMAKKVVRAEVHGPSNSQAASGSNYFTTLTKRMRERQQHWHSGAHALPPDFPRDGEGQLIGGPRVGGKEDQHVCLKMIGYAEQLVDGLDWT